MFIGVLNHGLHNIAGLQTRRNLAQVECAVDFGGVGLSPASGADVAVLLNFWGTDGTGYPGVDLDGDGIVGGTALATMLGAGHATALLADFGAEVIHVEAPGKGDHLRQFGFTVDGSFDCQADRFEVDDIESRH